MKLSSTSQKSADARVLSASTRDSASGSTPIVLDLGGAGSEALRPPPPPSQRFGSISFQTTQLRSRGRGTPSACSKWLRHFRQSCFRSLLSALASVKGRRRDHIRRRRERSRLRARSRLPLVVARPASCGTTASIMVVGTMLRRGSIFTGGQQPIDVRSRPRGECHLPARQTNCRPSSLLDAL